MAANDTVYLAYWGVYDDEQVLGIYTTIDNATEAIKTRMLSMFAASGITPAECMVINHPRIKPVQLDTDLYASVKKPGDKEQTDKVRKVKIPVLTGNEEPF